VQKKLISWRRYHGITQKEMADKLGVDVRTYINKEQGVTQFKANEMFLIADILGKEISEIFLPTNSMKHEVGKEKTESR
jgi:DNA-binding XRE family transcriptional regulator